MIIAAFNAAPAQPNLAILCALIIGALLGFLWFNVHPAQIFMGDSGALALGATLAVTALITGQILLLPFIGIIFVLEARPDIARSRASSWHRQTALQDEPAAPPLRAARLARREDHPPLLDRGRPGGDGRRGVLLGDRGTLV